MDFEKLNERELRRIRNEPSPDIASRLAAEEEIDRRKRERHRWSRGDKWTAAAVIVGLLTLLATVFPLKMYRKIRLKEPTRLEGEPHSPAPSAAVRQSTNGPDSPIINSSGGGTVNVQVEPPPSQPPRKDSGLKK